MADPQAGKRYAQAAFDIANRDGTVTQWRSDLDDIALVLAESAAAPVFVDPKVPVDRKYAVVDRALDVQPVARNFAKVLIQKGRAGDARAVAIAFGLMADESEGIAHAEVVARWHPAVPHVEPKTPVQLTSAPLAVSLLTKTWPPRPVAFARGSEPPTHDSPLSSSSRASASTL